MSADGEAFSHSLGRFRPVGSILPCPGGTALRRWGTLRVARRKLNGARTKEQSRSALIICTIFCSWHAWRRRAGRCRFRGGQGGRNCRRIFNSEVITVLLMISICLHNDAIWSWDLCDADANKWPDPLRAQWWKASSISLLSR